MGTPQVIIDKLRGLTFDEAIKQGKYVLHYAKNLENLQDAIRQLDDRREIIHRKVCEAIDDGEEIFSDVKTWQREADMLKNDVDQLMGEITAKGNMYCIACSCSNIKWRYRLSKQAKNKIQDVKELAVNSHFEEIAHRKPPPLEIEFPSDENYVNFDSRTSIFHDIVDALKDSSVKMIGVHGPGGVGKTTLVKEVGKKMRYDGYFKQVSLATISKGLTVQNIQSQLADGLDFNFHQGSRATQLWNKLTNGDKYLIILDDIWEKVDIKAIGIPIIDVNQKCKVLVTSRNRNLLLITMKVQKLFSIAELSEAEAWDFFKKKVGNSFEFQPKLNTIGHKVFNKCKGLPVAINAIGKALQDKPGFAWNDALVKLERSELMKIEGIDSSVWPSLRLSYDLLESLNAKSFFLLCCLFREDADIPIGDLTRHCLARRLFSQNPRTLEEVRNSVYTVIDALKSASLLSNGSHENVVRMHGITRDVGISIAREEKAYYVEHDALHWPENPIHGPSYSAISLISGSIEALPTKLTYPKLHTLMFENSKLSDLEVPDEFFSGMAQLSVLILTRIRMRKLPSSLGKLANLRMLYLIECDLADIAILGDLNKNLEVLSLQGSSIKALPPKLGQLTSLRVLDLEECDVLNVIPRGIISNLTKLEELYFPDTFYEWEETTDEKQETSNNNVSLEELRWFLGNGQLTTLHVNIPDVLLLKESRENVERFRILMDSNLKVNENIPRRKVLKHEGSSLSNDLIPLVDDSEVLYLSCIKGLKNVIHNGGVGNVYLDMEYLDVRKSFPKCYNLRHFQSFNKLIVLRITECKSKYLFSHSTSSELVHLEELIVQSCEVMEEIVRFEGQNDEDELTSEVRFSKLKRLVLQLLPNLLRFYAKKEKMGTTTTGSSSARAQPLFNEKVIFPVLEVFEVDGLDKIEEIWDKQSPLDTENSGSCCKLRDMKVQHCNELMNLFPSSILLQLGDLQKLCVKGCPNIESVVIKNEKEQEAADYTTLVMPQLRYLTISDMKNLKSFYSSSAASNAQSLFNYQVTFPRLENLELEELQNVGDIWGNEFLISSLSELKCLKVERCANLGSIFRPSIARVLVNLQELIINDCSKMQAAVHREEELEDGQRRKTDETLLPNFTKLELRRLPELKRFCHFTHPLKLPLLSHMVIKVCPRLNSFSLGRVSTPNLFPQYVSYDFVGDDTTMIPQEIESIGGGGNQ